jgi:glycosyltransferase involved in cell wall biosynthesis
MYLFNPYYPDPRVSNEALSLSKSGFKVILIAWKREEKYKSFKDNNIDIYHIGPSLPSDFINRPIVAQAAIKLLAMLIFSIHALLLTRKLKPDILHAHDMDTLHIGVLSSKIFKKPLIYDAHEIFGQMMSKSLPGWIIKWIEKIEKILIKYAILIITVSRYHEAYFTENGAKNVLVVSNCKEFISPNYMPSDNPELVIIYIGTLLKSRFLLEGIEVCNGIDGIRFRIAGSGPIQEKIVEESKNLKNIEFIGRIPSDEVIPETQKADVVFCVLNPSNINNRIGPPNKLFEAMVAGRPVIATNGTYSGEIVEEEEMGIAIDFSKESFRMAIIMLRDNKELVEKWGKNALRSAQEKYNWGIEEKKLVETYKELIKDN